MEQKKKAKKLKKAAYRRRRAERRVAQATPVVWGGRFSRVWRRVRASLRRGVGVLKGLVLALLWNLYQAVLFFVSFVWQKTSFSWVFLQVGRIGFYLFFKHAAASGVPLFIWATGATKPMLAFPLFFFFILPRKFLKKYFGLSWGAGPLLLLVAFTGWWVYFLASLPVLRTSGFWPWF